MPVLVKHFDTFDTFNTFETIETFETFETFDNGPQAPDHHCPTASGFNALSMVVDAGSEYFNMPKTTIYGGSNEIQRNILSRTILEL